MPPRAQFSRADKAIARARAGPGWCDECQQQHTPAARQARLRTVLPCTPEELRDIVAERWSCMYGPSGERSLLRDVRALGYAASPGGHGDYIRVSG